MAANLVFRCSCGNIYSIDESGTSDLEAHLALNPTHAAVESYADLAAGTGLSDEITITSPTGELYNIKITDNGTITTINNSTEEESVRVPKANYSAVSDPSNTDDSSEGYEVGSKWINTNSGNEFVCVDALENSAVWSKTTVDEPNIAQYVRTSNQTIGNSESAIDFNLTQYEDSNYTRSGSTITITSAGIYKVYYNINFETGTNSRRTLSAWAEKNSIEIVASRSNGYARNNTDNTESAGALFFETFAANDTLTITAQNTGSGNDLIALGNQVWVSIEFIRSA